MKTTASTRLPAYSPSECPLPSTPGREKSGAVAPCASRGRSPSPQAATTTAAAATTRRDDTRASWKRIRKRKTNIFRRSAGRQVGGSAGRQVGGRRSERSCPTADRRPPTGYFAERPLQVLRVLEVGDERRAHFHEQGLELFVLRAGDERLVDRVQDLLVVGHLVVDVGASNSAPFSAFSAATFFRRRLSAPGWSGCPRASPSVW